MTGSSRRIFLYWLLLLLPTLAVGVGALVLLRREQDRVAERSAEALEARRANTAARARLTVETIELLVGDVENGLLDTLVAEPAEGLEGFLDRWEKENPLVRTAFRLSADGRVVRPDARSTSDDGRAFLRRFSRQFGAQAPWVITPPAPVMEGVKKVPELRQMDAAASKDVALAVRRDEPEITQVVATPQTFPAVEPDARKEIARNVAQAQEARRSVQELVKTPSYSNTVQNPPVESSSLQAARSGTKTDSSGKLAADVSKTAKAKKAEAKKSRPSTSSSSFYGSNSQTRRDVQPLLKAPDDSTASSSSAPVVVQTTPEPPKPDVAEMEAKRKAEADQLALADRSRRDGELKRAELAAASARKDEEAKTEVVAPAVQKKIVGPDRRGWVAANVDGRMRLTGWFQSGATGEVRGVEVNLTELVNRFGGALPTGVGPGEGYALRDDQGRLLQVVGAVSPTLTPAARVPLAAALLPGWEMAGYLSGGSAQAAGATNFVWISTLLVGIFLVAILAGGSLLLWQARRSEEEAAQKTSFVANVSHEFKTPLTTIRLYAELLEQGRVRDAAQGEGYLRTIGRETQRLARLVNNALDFSRLEQGKKKFSREPVDLGVEVIRLLDTHGPRLAEAGLAVRRELPVGPVTVLADRDAVEQIVINLLDNAAKYAATGGELTVAVAAGPRRGAELRVMDRGPGVPAEHRERIFEKFHRVDDALTAEKSGAGLGLSIARQLARGLGGELRYVPRAGGGAEFILSLP